VVQDGFMTNLDGATGFYEEDEPIESVLTAYEQGNEGTTAPPDGWPAGQQAMRSSNFESFAPGLTPAAAPVRDRARLGQLVQA